VVPTPLASLNMSREDDTHQRQIDPMERSQVDNRNASYHAFGRCDMTCLKKGKIVTRVLDRILIASGLPVPLFGAHLTHELMHVFIFLSGHRGVYPSHVEESHCNAAAILYLMHRWHRVTTRRREMINNGSELSGKSRCGVLRKRDGSLAAFGVRKFLEEQPNDNLLSSLNTTADWINLLK